MVINTAYTLWYDDLAEAMDKMAVFNDNSNLENNVWYKKMRNKKASAMDSIMIGGG